jgi:DNA replication protein DnaC
VIGDIEVGRCNLCQVCEALIEAQQRADTTARQETERKERLARWTVQLPFETRTATIESFDPKHNKKTVAAVQRWLEGYTSGPYPSLILYSSFYGVGKTHIACAIANDVMGRWQGHFCPVRFVNGPRLLDRIKDTYRNDAHETKADVLRDLRDARLLILDDVGKEKPSDHTREVYYEIVEDRISTGWPVVVTSNLPLEAKTGRTLTDLMGGAAISRLISMCKGNYFELTGPDHRRAT